MKLTKLILAFIVGWLRAIVSSAFLSVALVTRFNIGANSIDLWHNKRAGKQEGQRWTGTFQRVFAVVLTYLWCRWFFLMQYMPHGVDEDHTKRGVIERQLKYFAEEGLKFNYFDSVDINSIDVPYFIGAMYCVFILVLGIAHILSIEILRNRGKAVPRLALGQSILFGWIRDKWRWQINTYSRMWEWSLLEPLIPVIGAVVSFTYGYEAYGWFFVCATVSMLFTARQRNALFADAVELFNERDHKGGRWARYLRSHNRDKKLSAIPEVTGESGEDEYVT
jgi:hypothetical protein